MITVYVLYSDMIDRLYVGQTQDLRKRLREHLEGVSFYTRRATDWKLILSEEYETRSDAMQREKQFKTTSGRRYLRRMLEGNC